MNFLEDKNNYLKILTNIESKLLFPTTLINSLKKYNLTTLGAYFSSYNSYIIKSRELLPKLNALEKWDLFYNSKFFWNLSISSVVSGICVYTKEIIDHIQNNNDVMSIMLMKQCMVNLNNIKLFLKITKTKDGYAIKKDNTGEEIMLNQQTISNLLPRCIDQEKIAITNSFIGSYENPHNLEEMDRI